MKRSRFATHRNRRSGPVRHRRLWHEFLEDRLCLAVFVVDAPGDEPDLLPGDGQARTVGGTTTLRAAIMEANSSADKDTIKFAIRGDGPHVIQPVEALPALTRPIIIDGYLDNPDASSNTNSFELGSNAELDVVLDGSQRRRAPTASRSRAATASCAVW